MIMEKPTITPEQLAELSRWVNSPEGQAAFAERMKAIEPVLQRLERMSHIPRERLEEEYTI